MTEPVPTHLKAALSCEEAGELVGLSDTSIRRLIEDGVLRRVKHTQRVLVSRTEIDRWLADGQVAS